MLFLLIAGILHAETAAVQVSAARQDSISRMQAMRRVKLSVYSITACSDTDMMLPAGRALQALATRGVPSEAPALLPLIMARAKASSTLGKLRTAGEYASGAAAIGLAVKSVGGYWAALPPFLGFALGRVRGRQDELLEILLPLAKDLIDPASKLPIGDGVCHHGFVISGGDVPYAEVEIAVRVPDAPTRRVNWQRNLSSWARRVDVEFVPR